MSMPSTDFLCSKCDFTGSSTVSWGGFKYTDGKTELQVDRKLGWCSDCAKLQPIEHLDADECLAAIYTANTDLSKASLLIKALKFIGFESLDDHQGKITEYTLLLYIVANRKGGGKCLVCSSENTLPFGSNKLLNHSGVGKTGFVHPECGGDIIASPCPIWKSVIMVDRLYDYQGLLISETRR